MNETRDREETNVTSKLFGSVRSLHYTGNHQPTLTELRELARLPNNPTDGVANTYCAGCGTVAPVNQNGLEGLSKKAGISVPADLTGKYFLVQRCPLCGDEFKEPELKTL